MSKLYHLSRLNAPKTWPIKRKEIKWVAKPLPGTHTLYHSMPLSIYLRDILGLASINQDIKRLLNKGFVKVNGKIRKELNFSVGLFDVLSLTHTNKHYRVAMTTNGLLNLVEVPASESKLVPVKVNSKTTVSGGKLQVNLNNGWNFLAEKDSYKVDDVVLFDVEKNKPAKHLKLAEGNVVYVIGGKHVGLFAKLEGLKETGDLKKKKIAILKSESETWETPVNQLLVVGEKESEIKLTK